MRAYFPTINILRGIAALFVCLNHFTCYSDFRGSLFPADSAIHRLGESGANGVFIFFVISGFVIPLSLIKDRFKPVELHRYLFRRFIRIEIPYIISIFLVLLTALAFALKNHQPFEFNAERFLYHIFYVIPFSEYEWYNIIYWTLAIEFQFYIVAGIIHFFLSSGNKWIFYAALALFGASAFIFTDNRLVFHYAPIFLQGILLMSMKSGKLSSRAGLAFIALCCIGTAMLFTVEIAAFSAITVLCILYAEVNNKVSDRFGAISYSLYLTHGFIGGNIIYLLSRYISGTSAKLGLVVVAAAASLLFAALFWKFIENPARVLSKRIRSHKEQP
ncbi:MAG: putative acyltransferase [Bacteroidetes bacterium]|nr:putative acyltransferase [Bacteroidota bacterium]